MATIRASHTVIPNEPTPNCHLWLSDNDHSSRLGHTPTIYIYKAKNNQDAIIERMKISLSKILVHYYPLAGRLVRMESGRLEINCNAKGVIFVEAESTKTFQDFGDFSPSDSIKELAPKIDYSSQPIPEIPLFLVQLTRFNGDEGIAIGVAFSHAVADGFGAIHFINSWAKLTRGEALDSNEMPFLDRIVLKFSHAPSESKFDHPELKPLPLKLGASSSIDEQKKKTCAETLKISLDQVEKLKKKANIELEGSSSGPYSKFEAIAAHIWRCACKARELDENQPTIIRLDANIRTRIIPPLPKNYFGNAVTTTITPKCHVGEILSNPFSCVAHKIREAVEVLTNEYIRSQLSVILSQEKLDCIKSFFLRKGEPMYAPFGGNPNLHLTSWIGMPVYEADFGWEKPIHFGLAYVVSFDRALILLSPDGDDSVLVCMHFQTAYMQLFKKFFYDDI